MPRTYREAVQLEKDTGLPWTKATQEETTEKLVEAYDSFELLKDGETPPGPEFQRVKLKTIWTRTAEGKCKARTVALGNRIDAEEHSRYCNVVQTLHARAVMTVGLETAWTLRSATSRAPT